MRRVLRQPWLAFDPRHQLLDLGFLFAAQRQERQARGASVVAAQVHGVLHARDAKLADHALGGEFQALLLFAGESGVSVLERGENFVARMGAALAKAKMAPTAPRPSEGSSWCAAPTMTWNPTSFLRVFNLPTTVTAEDEGFLGLPSPSWTGEDARRSTNSAVPTSELR